MTASPGVAAPPVRWTLSLLSQRVEHVEAQAELEARELAKALSAQAVAMAADADVGEYRDRLDTLSQRIWPKQPLDGYALQSSLGTFLVARIAIGWAEPAEATPRETPLTPEALIDELTERGVNAAAARSTVSDWAGVADGFEPFEDGLDIARLAGLAELTLSKAERDEALSQVASSPRCLSRLASTCQCLWASRRVLAVLPGDDELGADYNTAIAAIALRRPDRALALLGPKPVGAAQRALAELAEAEWMLTAGRTPRLAADDGLPHVPTDRDPLPRAESLPPSDDDIVDMVEEVVEEGYSSGPPAAALPRSPRWTRPEWPEMEFDDTFVRLWREGRSHRRSLFSHLDGLLGLRSAAVELPHPAIPPDDRTIRRVLDERSEPTDANNAETERIDVTAFIREQQDKLGLSSVDPLLPGVRAALRAVVGAAEGRAPTFEAIETAGDLDWVARRARAIALAVQGNLRDAIRAVGPVGGTSTPEGRFVDVLRMRFDGREAEPLENEAARRLAAGLVHDLAVQLGRTISGAADA